MAKPHKNKKLPNGEIDFHFVKGSCFRVIHIDGAIGGVAPGSDLINMAIYSERQPIPQKVTHKIQDGIVGPEIMTKRETKAGVFRELEADLVMSLETASAMRSWLDEKIKDAQNRRELASRVTKVKGK